MPLKDFNDCLKFIICDEPTSSCYEKTCEKCPGIQHLKRYLHNLLSDDEEAFISFKQWVNEPQCTLESITKNDREFIDYFCGKIDDLLLHDFICKQQYDFLRQKKESLKLGELIVIQDFAENYAFVVQNAAQAFHWNNNQATIYPVVVYYRDKHKDELKNINYVITSDNSSHDAVAVHTFMEIIIDDLKKTFEKTTIHCTRSGRPSVKKEKIRKIYYFSDGAPQQFKNYKNVLNLYNHESDFGIPAEWHFFPTAHGKGPCDGLGGTVKRSAASASLQLPHDKQILTPTELHEWFINSDRFKNIRFMFSPIKDYKKKTEKVKLEVQQFEKS